MTEGKSANIIYAVLCSEGNVERTLNVKKLKEAIPELKIVISNRENVFRNHIGLFDLGANSDCDGIIILEDDVQLCKDFKTKATELVSEHKDEVVSMFESALSRKELHSEYRAGNRFNWCQCNYYPKAICKILSSNDMVTKFKEWYARRNEPWNYPIDTYIGYVLGYHGLKYWMQVPFLVQHLPLRSNFKGRPLNRQSKFFIDDVEK